MRRSLYGPEHESFRSAFRTFLDREAVPYVEKWEEAGSPEPEFILKAAESGYFGFELDPVYGGLGISDFRYNAVMTEEVVESGIAGDTFSMQNDIIVPYLRDGTSGEQRARWLPQFTGGRAITALAMTEPGAGSDLASITTSARFEGDSIVINGSKTFITSGATCDLAIVLVRTGEREGRGTSLVVVEHGTPGFTRGRPLHKIGRKGQDTAELVFDDCAVPVDNLIGEPGRGLATAMSNLARERLSMAVSGMASARHVLAAAVDQVQNRRAFGGRLADLQSVRMTIGDLHTEVQVLTQYVDRCVQALNTGDLSADDAAGAKTKATELQWQVLDTTLQLFGGYGYMEEYPIARQWRDARVQRIYGGANEVLRDLVGRSVVGR